MRQYCAEVDRRVEGQYRGQEEYSSGDMEVIISSTE